MFEKFTERARKVMSLARQESQRLNADFIGTEHILLGIVREAGGGACKVLKNLKIDSHAIVVEIDKLITPTTTPTKTLGQLPFSPRSKRVIELAGEAASQLGDEVIGTEHLLLGLMKENEGIAAQVLTNLDLKIDQVRDMVLYTLGDHRKDKPTNEGALGTTTTNEVDIQGTIIDVSRSDTFTVLQRDGTCHAINFDHLGTPNKELTLGRRIHIHFSVNVTFLD